MQCLETELIDLVTRTKLEIKMQIIGLPGQKVE